MMKKRNMAVAMAAVTVATTAAPAFAAVETSTVTNKEADKAALIAKVDELLAVKYTNSTVTGEAGTANSSTKHLNSVYKITVSADTAFDQEVDYDGTNDLVVVKNGAHLRDLLEKAEVKKELVEITIVDKGHKDVNGTIVSDETTDKLVVGVASGETITSQATAANDLVGRIVKTGGITSTLTEVKIDLVGGKTITLTDKESYALDFTRPVLADGTEITVAEATGDVAKMVVGFATKQNTAGEEENVDLPQTTLEKITVTNANYKEINVNADDLFNGTALTKDGKVLDSMISAKKTSNAGSDDNINLDGKTSVIINGDEYLTTQASATPTPVVKDGEGYSFDIIMEVNKAEATRALTYNDNVKLTIKGNDLVKLNKLYALLSNGYIESADAEDEILAGRTRFETAIEVSKKAYPTGTTADSIVLVNRDAVVDGLAAAPFAAVKNAPILLTDVDAVREDVVAEMKRALGGDSAAGKTVYLVGGDARIDDKVKSQLAEELGVKVVRISGKTRQETSLKLAEEVVKASQADTNAYIVGGNGLADAMSIASVAAKDKAPIIVTNKDELSDDAKSFLKTNGNANGTDKIGDVFVIGGDAVVGTKVLTDAKEQINANETVERVYGKNRQMTNAAVIDEFYSDSAETKFYVAHSSDDKLVDALAAAPLAGKAGNVGPIVLVGEELDKNQETVIKSKKHNTDTSKHVQVGKGVVDSVISKIKDLLK